MKRKFVFLIFTYLVLASCTNGQVNTRERQIRFPKYEKFVCLGKETPSTNLKKNIHENCNVCRFYRMYRV